MNNDLLRDRAFRKQAKEFAKWFGLERRAALELGRIAADWLEHYSRTHNAEKLAEAIRQITKVSITGRSLRYYRDIYLLHVSWTSRPRSAGNKCGNDFQICHVGPGHLRVVASAKLTTSAKHRLCDEVERQHLTVKQTTARARQCEVDANRRKRTVRLRQNDPRVVRGDAIDVVQRLDHESIHHLFADWQWDNSGVWRESYKAKPVYRPDDPAEHLASFIKTARPFMNKQCVLWIFSKTTAFEGGQIGLPWIVQEAANEAGLLYCSEFVAVHNVAGYRSKNTFLAVKHLPLHPFVPEGFDFAPVTFAPSVSQPRTSPNHISQMTVGEEKHPYQKPVELFEDLISMGSPNGLVFDGFSGSGVSGIAAVRSGCPYLGAEQQQHYVRMANRAIALALSEHDNSTQSA